MTGINQSFKINVTLQVIYGLWGGDTRTHTHIDDFVVRCKNFESCQFLRKKHAVVTGKCFEDGKTSKLAALIDSCLYNKVCKSI